MVVLTLRLFSETLAALNLFSAIKTDSAAPLGRERYKDLVDLRLNGIRTHDLCDTGAVCKTAKSNTKKVKTRVDPARRVEICLIPFMKTLGQKLTQIGTFSLITMGFFVRFFFLFIFLFF